MAHCMPLFARSRGASLAGLGTPIITEAFPPAELGFALGINSIAWVLGSLIGPVAGGLLVSVWGWRSIFIRNNPLQSGRSGHRLARFTSFPTQELKNAFD